MNWRKIICKIRGHRRTKVIDEVKPTGDPHLWGFMIIKSHYTCNRCKEPME